MKKKIEINEKECLWCPLGNYIQSEFSDQEGNDAICNLCFEENEVFKKNNKKIEIITLCGSTKFKKLFIHYAKEFYLQGKIVLKPDCFGHIDNDKRIWKKKKMLDKIHKSKIDLSDSIFIINKNGYIGKSTKNEIEYAINNNKKIIYMEKPND